MANRLASETSPYLLQHAHNPVDWFPWGDEALSMAREQQKPILVSIGYAACHWCHVMERESFEDARVAAFMNELFINIKIDREERPDLDHIYMDAVQSMTGSGGWPLNVFLTPEGKPFYGGTYFPPQAAFNRPSWSDVLHGIAGSWRDRRDEVYSQAERLTGHLVQANAIGKIKEPSAAGMSDAIRDGGEAGAGMSETGGGAASGAAIGRPAASDAAASDAAASNAAASNAAASNAAASNAAASGEGVSKDAVSGKEVDGDSANREAVTDQPVNEATSVGKTGAGADFLQNMSDTLYKDQLHAMATALLKTADKQEGGFGQAPKFPQTMSIAYLFRYAWLFSDRHPRPGAVHPSGGTRRVNSSRPGGEAEFPQAGEAMQHALLSVEKMMRGGIYDQLGGGLARYSTDNDWLVPHFEKMLYDQALFIGVLCDAYQLTGDSDYARVIHQTMDFIQREMLSPEGGFYSALDADSEGEEGKYYVWRKKELEELLGPDAALACAWYGVTEKGNWEGINILTKPIKRGQLLNLIPEITDEKWLDDRLAEIEEKLLARRSQRIPPGLDDKQLLAWNALMNMACSQAFAATGRESYRQLAIRNMDFMKRVFMHPEKGLMHTYKSGIAKFPAFLDDYAYLVQALIYLQELTGNTDYLDLAGSLVGQVLTDFGEEGNHLFYYTGQRQTDVIVRKREVYDGAQPSGNAVMAFNLQYLGLVLDRPDWRLRAAGMLESLSDVVTRYPGSFGFWATECMRAAEGCAEIVVVGQDADALRTEILANFIPFKVLQSATSENNAYPLLRNKPSAPESLIYVCQNYSCRQPVASVEALLRQI
ncbi:thioredoxin domain-containing protein [Flavihumibacter stibioxidans]|uniref:Spermatogenesis-associated protein 20-like TRX domain-containing protein n=1 Tax=Flavihumibacter stibioxidans TaxID=1834163 RepID=A0ABR7M8U9_9BACT|nr:thioredoxin domain-containing protein [Flavihumibacter stibioxidans]MBC6490959.1 hypothetical protein [Flavihumibacter stibioxidans]